MFLMKTVIYIFIIGICALATFSCKNTHAYDKYVKELDSLKVVVQQSVDNFKTVDSVSCYQANIKQKTYTLFIDSHLTDTVSKSVAESLQNFHSVGKGLQEYIEFRETWLKDAHLSITQLQTLSHDLKNGSINEDEAIEFINNEKKQAEKIIEELKVNTETIRKNLGIYNTSLPECENLVKQLNAGVLPELINPNIK